MELVKLADSYERQSARDFDSELQQEGLSRRQLVSIEDAKKALQYSTIIEAENYQNAQVSFRHLAMLAQIKQNDADIWASISEANPGFEVTPSIVDRLKRMRTWIQSTHFPDEMRVEIIATIPEAVNEFTEEEKSVLSNMIQILDNCDWDKDSINSGIPESAKSLELSPKIAYRVAYICLMGIERGPRLAPILEQMKKSQILNQLRQCL